jgi:hypothetical protein
VGEREVGEGECSAVGGLPARRSDSARSSGSPKYGARDSADSSAALNIRRALYYAASAGGVLQRARGISAVNLARASYWAPVGDALSVDS